MTASNPLSLDSILQTLGDNGGAVSTKTASESRTAPSTVEAEMLSTVQAFAQKQASASAETVEAAPASDSAVQALRKIASDTAAAEDLATIKTAQLAGAAMCDGFMARLAGYDASIAQKTASAVPATAPAGGYTEEHLKLAYAQGLEDFEKNAAAEYEQGQTDALNEIHKTAAKVHYAGQASARNVLLALSAAEGGN